MDAWENNAEETIINLKTSKKIKSIILGNDFIPDRNKKNNVRNL
jgi:hypothetical protein